MKETVIEIKHCQLSNILIKLDHIQKISQMISKNLTHVQLTIAIKFISTVDHDKSV